MNNGKGDSLAGAGFIDLLLIHDLRASSNSIEGGCHVPLDSARVLIHLSSLAAWDSGLPSLTRLGERTVKCRTESQ